MGLAINSVYQGDCTKLFERIEPGGVDLVFADPPFNIGYRYDVYHDERTDEEYLRWTRRWMAGVSKVLKPSGTFWLAIGDEYAAELKLIAQRELGFTCRSWVIWYYTFGVNCTRVFSRSHTHLFYFIKDPKNFTFNADNPVIRVPSARQLVYKDSRANPNGRLPDNTWILRPQDAPDGFAPDHDTWYFSRVAGTFKEREGFHGCQMPEQLLGRIIRCSSNPSELVLDPFSGSGTTLAVAKKLGRRWLGFELSQDYVKRIKTRLKIAKLGDRLGGPSDPLRSAPQTHVRKKTHRNASLAPSPARKTRTEIRGQSRDESNGFIKGIIDAYEITHDGFSVDYMLADSALNNAFLDACKKNGLAGGPVEWNRSLLRVRKSGKLPRLRERSKKPEARPIDLYRFASEVALQQLSVEFRATLDGILCDPKLAAKFDELAQSFSPGYSSFEYRWAALTLRKRAVLARRMAQDQCEWLHRKLPRPRSMSGANWSRHNYPGIYLLVSRSRQPLYVGEAANVRWRLDLVSQTPSWQRLEPASATLIRKDHKRVGLQSILISRVHPLMNLQSLALDPEVVR